MTKELLKLRSILTVDISHHVKQPEGFILFIFTLENQWLKDFFSTYQVNNQFILMTMIPLMAYYQAKCYRLNVHVLDGCKQRVF